MLATLKGGRRNLFLLKKIALLDPGGFGSQMSARCTLYAGASPEVVLLKAFGRISLWRNVWRLCGWPLGPNGP